MAVAAWEWGAYLGEEGLRKGIRAKISSWRRIGSSTIPATAKAGGQYLNSILAKIESHKAGYQEAILLNEAGYVADGSGENLFLVRDGALVTPPVQASILEGITRASIIALAGDEGIPVLEREVARGELYTADEVFITGTAAEVCPVNEVDDHALGPPGPDHAAPAGALLRGHRGARPALGRVAGLRRDPRGVACRRERARRHLRHDAARRHAARGPEPVGRASSSPWPCGWPSTASTTSRPASRPATRSTASSSGCWSARTSGATRLAAFGMTRRRGAAASEDPALRGLAESAAPVATIVGKTWDLHIEKVTRVSREENLRMIERVGRLPRRRRARRSSTTPSTSSTPTTAHPDYALDCLRAAEAGGAAWITPCDTNGATLPARCAAVMREVRAALPGAALGIHTHNDAECAVANSLAAVERGRPHGPGHDQRLRRALRERQPRLDHPAPQR